MPEWDILATYKGAVHLMHYQIDDDEDHDDDDDDNDDDDEVMITMMT